MTRILLLWMACAVLLTTQAMAQSTVFNPNDPLVDYNPNSPPPTPQPNTITKWVRTKRPDITWNTDNFKSYIYDSMSFRLRYPNGYNAADPTKKYPLIIFFHGGGETGPLSDNESQLILFAKDFEGMMNNGQYNAFMLFPQVSQPGIWEDFHFSRVNHILDSLQRYCHLDPDRVIAMGLSMGSYGAVRFSAYYPQRSSVVIGASPALIQTLPDTYKDNLLHMPLWIGNGGLDTNPDSTVVNNFVNYITSKGGDIRHTFYPNENHFIWNLMFGEPPLIPYWKAAHKATPTVFYNKRQFDMGTAINTRLGITAGFYAYEWQRDSVTIATRTNGSNTIVDPLPIINFTGNEITVNSYGSYRVRFKRSPSADWSEWSQDPAYIYNGLKFKYYEGPWTALPDFNTLTPVSSGTSPNVDINSRPVNTYDHFAMRWDGSIYIPTAGTYTFETYSDDGSKLYFNTPYSASATATVDNDGSHGPTSKTGTVNVAAPGWYPITITYLEVNAGELMQVYWSGPGIGRQLIPNSAFTRPVVLTDNTAPTTPSNLKSDYTGRTFADLSWTASTDNVGVTRYDVYVNGALNQSTTSTKITINSLNTGSAYTFSVKAVDPSNNQSAASNTLSVTPGASGLRYKYYEGSWTNLPDFSTLTPIKTGTSANFDLTPKILSDNFGFVWEGYIYIPTPGNYNFETFSDDGSKVYFNTFYNNAATPVVNNDGQHDANTSKNGNVNVAAAGWYPFTVTFFDAIYAESIKVFWTGPGIPRQQIPDAAFVEFNGSDASAPTAPSLLKSDYTGRTFADLSWTASSDNIGVTRYDVYVNGALNQSVGGNILKASVSNLTNGTPYTFTVKAADAAGNQSAASNSLAVTPAANGLRYKYYEGNNWQNLPDFSTLTPVKTGTSANFDLTPKVVSDNFGFVWEGYIYIPTAGNYTFETMSDDGSKVYFNSFYSPSANALVNNDGIHDANTPKTGNINIATAGWYPIAVTFFDGTYAESIKVFWTGPGIPRQQIPDASFVEYTGSDATPPTTPSSLKSDYTGRTFADLSWTASSDNIGVTRYDVYVNGALNQSVGGTITKATVNNLTPGSPYNITVKAADAAGNQSPVSNSLAVTPAANGLRYKYYEGNWANLPDFSTLTPIKTGTSANLDLTPKVASDNFGFVWEGYIYIPTPGNYNFETFSDDGSKVYFNTFYNNAATPVVNNDGQHDANTSKNGNVNVAAAGWYPFTVTFFDAFYAESIKLYWTGPGIPRQQVPDAAFMEAGGDVTPPTAPTGLKSDFTTRTFVDMSWIAASDNLAVTRYDVYANGTFNQSVSAASTRATVNNLTPGAAYTFTVKAVDAAGNQSPVSNPLTLNTFASGLRYKYYEGTWTNLPNFSTLTPVKTGTSANLDLTPKILSDRFGFVWEGYIHITTPGNYTFETMSDDGSKMYFNTFYDPNANALVNNDGQHDAFTPKGGTVNIGAAGWYPITVTFFDALYDESIKLYWTGPGITRQLVPNSAFSEVAGVNGDVPVSQTFRSGIQEMTDAEKDKFLQVSLYPNPFRQNLQMSFFNSAKDNDISVDIYDLSGRMVYNRNFGKLSPGATTLRFDLGGHAHLEAGTYVARLKVNGLPLKTWKLVKMQQ